MNVLFVLAAITLAQSAEEKINAHIESNQVTAHHRVLASMVGEWTALQKVFIGLDTTWPKDTKAYSDHVVRWIQDFRRTIDYVETRDDIDLEHLAFYGWSWGGWNGPIVLALDDRFKTGVFVSGGIPPTVARPEASSASFASRVTQRVLMISGKNDILRPVETFQGPMFASLGTADEDKRHAILDGGHSPARNQLIRETLDWLDRYLGPVN